MKIYTEINYEWLDNQLVETSSKSFEYEGNLTLCGVGGGGGGGTLEQIVSDPIGTAQESLTPLQENIVDPLMETFVQDPAEDVMEEMAEAGGVEEEEDGGEGQGE